MKKKLIKTFTINKNTQLPDDLKNLKAGKRIDKRSLKFLMNYQNGKYIDLFTFNSYISYLKSNSTIKEITKFLKVNPELLEFFI